MHNGILVTQNKNKFGRITYITLTVEGGKVTDSKAEYIDIKKYPKKNKEVAAMVDFFNNNPDFQKVLAKADTPFLTREEVACMICDAFIEETGADIAVINPGGVRIDGHPAGDITIMDVLEMDPFDNHAMILELTGKELLHMMMTYCHDNIFSFPFAGGMRCEVTLDANNPEKIKKAKLLTLQGKPLDMKRRYRVATNNYMPVTSEIPKGSGYTLNVHTTDLVMKYLKEKEKVSYQGTSRLKIIPSQ